MVIVLSIEKLEGKLLAAFCLKQDYFCVLDFKLMFVDANLIPICFFVHVRFHQPNPATPFSLLIRLTPILQ